MGIDQSNIAKMVETSNLVNQIGEIVVQLGERKAKVIITWDTSGTPLRIAMTNEW